MVSVKGGSGCEILIVTSYKPSDVLPILFSTGFLFELKIVASFFVRIVEQLESHSFPIEIRMSLFRFGYAWACVAVEGNI